MADETSPMGSITTSQHEDQVYGSSADTLSLAASDCPTILQGESSSAFAKEIKDVQADIERIALSDDRDPAAPQAIDLRDTSSPEIQCGDTSSQNLALPIPDLNWELINRNAKSWRNETHKSMAEHTDACDPPEWNHQPKQSIIKRICADFAGVSKKQITVERIYPSHPTMTDYTIKGIPIKNQSGRIVFRAYLPECPGLMTRSAAGTMRYIQQQITAFASLVPRVLTYCADASQTPLKFEYILMEYPPGMTLDEALKDTTKDQRIQLGKDLDELVKKWGNDPTTHFDKLGSIYEDDHCSVHAAKGKRTFHVGPMVHPVFYEEQRSYICRPGNEFGINTGPFNSAYDLMNALNHAQFVRILACGNLDWGESWQPKCPCPVDSALEQWSDEQKQIVESESRLTEESSFVLEKRSWSCQDILVVKSKNSVKITGVLNWEGAMTEPLLARSGRSSLIVHLNSTYYYIRDGEPPCAKFPSRDAYFDDVLSEIEIGFASREVKEEIPHDLWYLYKCCSCI